MTYKTNPFPITINVDDARLVRMLREFFVGNNDVDSITIKYADCELTCTVEGINADVLGRYCVVLKTNTVRFHRNYQNFFLSVLYVAAKKGELGMKLEQGDKGGDLFNFQVIDDTTTAIYFTLYGPLWRDD